MKTTNNTLKTKQPKARINKKEGVRVWKLNGKIHREDGPAIEWLDDPDTKAWYLNGLRHRTDGPAFERNDGCKMWFVNGVQHRIDGPAVVWGNGGEMWMVNGEYHRIGGPAWIVKHDPKSEREEWWVNNKRHRLDGPAVTWAKCPVWSNSTKEYWIDGCEYTEEEFNKLTTKQ